MSIKYAIADNFGSRKPRFAKDKTTVMEVDCFIANCSDELVSSDQKYDAIVYSPYDKAVCYGGVVEKSWAAPTKLLASNDCPLYLLEIDPAYDSLISELGNFCRALIARGKLSMTDSELANLDAIPSRIVKRIVPGWHEDAGIISHPLAWSYRLDEALSASFNAEGEYDAVYAGRHRKYKRSLISELIAQSSISMLSIGGAYVQTKGAKTRVVPGVKYSKLGPLLANCKTTPLVYDPGHREYLPWLHRKIEATCNGLVCIDASSAKDYVRQYAELDLQAEFERQQQAWAELYKPYKGYKISLG